MLLNTLNEDAIHLHKSLRGKIETPNRVPIDTGFGHNDEEEKGTLGLIYTGGSISSSRNK